ncbi:AAA family ATPase [Niabella aurantiaca]|uniref:AAA family ATPase n=1 Tax=Niabella aurantiaca TaxID=379900 RepID=UPI0003717DC5|nr:AAA family ATPase [Niabella aurantiaca]
MIKRQYINYFEIVKEHTTADAYPFTIPAIRSLKKVFLHPKVTFIIGENGSGKSTLLEALAVQYGFNAEGGSRNFSFTTRKTHSSLSDFLRIGRGIIKPRDGFFFRAESFYNTASYVDDLETEKPGLLQHYGNKSLHSQSHGESFFSLFMHRFHGQGLYILDEPEAALSPQRQLAFLVRMHELVRAESQLVIATHAPIILSYPNARIIDLSLPKPGVVTFKETAYYTIYKAFFSDPAGMLAKLGIGGA